MKTVYCTFTPPDAAYYAGLQTIATAGNFLLNGTGAIQNDFYGIAAINTPGQFGRTVSITSTGNQSGLLFTVGGYDTLGNPLSEILTGPNNSTVQTTNYFAQVTSVSANGAVGVNTSVGTGSTGASQWFIPTLYVTPFKVGIKITVPNPTINYTIQDTDFPLLNPTPPGVVPNNRIEASQDVNVVNATTSQLTSYDIPVNGIRCLVSQSSGGSQSLVVSFTQAGVKQ